MKIGRLLLTSEYTKLSLTYGYHVDVHFDVPLDMVDAVIRRPVRDNQIDTTHLERSVHFLQQRLNVFQVVLRAQHCIEQC